MGIRWLMAVALTAMVGGGFFSYSPSEAADLVVYKSPYCGCCGAWVKHMEENGFTVEVQNQEDVSKTREKLGVPAAMASCHTAVIGGYLVEGHVPAGDVRRLLAEKPAVKGIALPGMVTGSPGMEDPTQKAQRYQIVTFTQDGKTQVFADH